nr:LysM domain-containing protein [uncultured Aminipila sp.]
MQQYTVKPNDTLFLIAKNFGVPLVQLIRANPEISNTKSLYIGQIINIPDLLPIPTQLDTIESNAEDIIDDIYAADWEKAKDKVNSIMTNMDELTPLLQEALVPPELISGMNLAIKNLEQNVKQKKAYPAIAQANRITMYIPDMLDYFKIIIPTDVGRLDYLGRQIIINVEGNDWSEASNNYLIAKKIWERLKPQLDTKYSKDIDDFDQAMKTLGESINNRNYQNTIDNANILLDKVDVLETDFKQ